MRTVTAPRSNKKAVPHPLPLTRAWVEDYRRHFDAQLRVPWIPVEAREFLARYGLDPRLGEWLGSADRGTCHCGRLGAFLEQRANGWVWYCLDQRPDFRACHICGQPGAAFEYAGDRWLWYCQAHVG
jgi:hypothetical protein